MTTRPVHWNLDGCPHRRQLGLGANRPPGWRWARLAVPLLAAIGLVTGCGNDDDSAPAPIAISEASATIGAAGGTLDGPDGTQVVIPPQALRADTLIRIARSSAGAPAEDVQGYAPQGAMYEFTPHDIVFERPVTMRMPVPAAAAPASTSSTQAFAASPTVGWHPVDSMLAGGFATWQSASFSWLRPWDCSPELNDPFPCFWLRLITRAETATAGALTLTSTALEFDTQRTYALTQAATVRLTARYEATRDCRDARLTVLRRDQRNNTAGPLQRLIDNLPVGLADKPGSSTRSEGSHPFDVTLSNADNGTVAFGIYLSCQRFFQTAGRPVYRQSDRDFVVIVVNAAPAVTAPPVITQQPADVAVIAGASAAFTVAATAPDSLTLDWQRSNDAGVTWSTLAFSGTGYAFIAAVADTTARFRAQVCNVKANLPPNCIFSLAAALTVNAPAASGPLVALSMAAGFGSSLVAASDGTVWAWGYQVDPATGGYKAQSPWAMRPVQVQGLSGVKAVVQSASAGGATYALHTDGTVSAWGVNTTGGLGDRTTITRPLPVKVMQNASTPMDEVCAIVAGNSFLLMARETGCSPGRRAVTPGPWIVGLLSTTTIGGDSSASAPLDGAIAKAVPGWPAGQSVGTMTAPDAANSLGSAYFVTASGSRYVWGTNVANNLGADGLTFAPGTNGPVLQGSFWAGTSRVELGAAFSLALTSQGSLVAVGRNAEGQLGDGSQTSRLTLLAVPTLTNVTDFSAGQTSAAAITAGQLWAWGWNGSAPVTTPTRVGTASGFTKLVVGDIHALAIGPGGEVYSWGDSSYGALGRSGPAGTPTVVRRP